MKKTELKKFSGLIKTTVFTILSIVLLPLGWMIFVVTNRTPNWGHQALIRLFCATGGHVNDWITRFISLKSKRLEIDLPVGVLGDLRKNATQEYVDLLNRQGYVVFNRALPGDMCERLMDFALANPAILRRMDHEVTLDKPRTGLFNTFASPAAVRYDYPTEALIANSDVQELLADQSLLALAQSYLGSRPRADVLSMWWHTNYHAQPDSEAAQFYHFDMDRIKWLKVFIYLTDVGPDDGPHSFISGSHRTGAIPQKFLRKGYVRLGDDDVFSTFGADRQIEFAAPKGTIIVEDTRGLHKGKAVAANSRLILQLQFSNSLFGADYPRSRITGAMVPSLANMIARAPDVYSNFL